MSIYRLIAKGSIRVRGLRAQKASPKGRYRFAPISVPLVSGRAHEYLSRYFFNVHAIDLERLDVDANASAALVGFYLNFHTIAKATLMGLYGR